MNHQEIMQVLESCLLFSEGIGSEINDYGMNENLVLTGSKMCVFLKSKEIKYNKEI